ncbi:hypothetical protein E3P99_03386 [Wallemia hederae]|uniref:RGS domain-containing protein n=1 Tax=Wallemia hederae TaxID=1540922 RepID=A0A4T0FIE9_9BASI|nr:hypothetical protein E3P99_03386 [Wallemia hederae]
MKRSSHSHSNSNLAELLKQRSRREQFVEYLREKEKSIENLDFVLWYQDYENRYSSTAPPQQHLEVDSVLATFFSPQSASELNLDEECKVEVLRRVRECVEAQASIPPSVFEHTYSICCQLLESSSIPAFKAMRKSKRVSIRTWLGLKGSPSMSRTSSSSTISEL